ncbi:hypothetical protein AU381_26960 [Sinorhizobium glycinis]|uniref:Uncharacterized protein n=3 Tax=Sinorhizobium TaxID=28105 RepID=A0A178YP28_9HYPH|nr:hypothetical protein AU381_26960 [Sinorhizobium glycinis]
MTGWLLLAVSKETLRQWMMEAGIWVLRRERKKRVFQPRGRRDCFGELIQIDGSPGTDKKSIVLPILSTAR